MNAADQFLTIFRACRNRMERNKASAKDELIVALWEESQEQDEKIRAMALKISYLEMQNDSKIELESFTSMMGRICSQPTQVVSVATLKIV